jgi:hypothetical protein
MSLGKTMPKTRSTKKQIIKDVTYSFTRAMMAYGSMQP